MASIGSVFSWPTEVFGGGASDETLGDSMWNGAFDIMETIGDEFFSSEVDAANAIANTTSGIAGNISTQVQKGINLLGQITSFGTTSRFDGNEDGVSYNGTPVYETTPQDSATEGVAQVGTPPEVTGEGTSDPVDHNTDLDGDDASGAIDPGTGGAIDWGIVDEPISTVIKEELSDYSKYISENLKTTFGLSLLQGQTPTLSDLGDSILGRKRHNPHGNNIYGTLKKSNRMRRDAEGFIRSVFPFSLGGFTRGSDLFTDGGHNHESRPFPI